MSLFEIFNFFHNAIHASAFNLVNTFQNVDQWTLRVSCVELQLMFKQLQNLAEPKDKTEQKDKAVIEKEKAISEKAKAELNQWLDIVAKAAISVFQLNKYVVIILALFFVFLFCSYILL